MIREELYWLTEGKHEKSRGRVKFLASCNCADDDDTANEDDHTEDQQNGHL